MPTKTKTTRSSGVSHKKRTGNHHRVSKHYLKVYWPYAPIAVIVAVGLFIGSPSRNEKHGVLSYATEMSTSELLTATNAERLSHSTKGLQINSQLSAAAQAKAEDMNRRNYWSHNTPDGKAPWSFLVGAGYNYQKAGENLAYGFATSRDTVTGWMNSQSHRSNLLDPKFSEVGFGFVNSANYNGDGKETIVVAMYGQPSTTTAAGEPSPQTPLTSETLGAVEPTSTAVSKFQSVTGISLPWATFALGIISGVALLLFTIRHGLAFKRVLIHGEQFLLHHPLVDIALVAIVMTGYVFTQTTGFIK